MTLKPLIFTIASAALAGCAHAEFASSNTQEKFTPSRTAVQIEVFKSQMPAKKYKEIGSVVVCAGGKLSSNVELLKKKAAENGGEALIGLEQPSQNCLSAAVIRYQ